MNKTRIYLTGPVAGRSAQQLEEFSIAKSMLIQRGYEVVTPIDVTEVFSAPAKSHESIMMVRKLRATEMFNCGRVLHLQDPDDECKAELEFARHIGYDIMPLEEFMNTGKKNV